MIRVARPIGGKSWVLGWRGTMSMPEVSRWDGFLRTIFGGRDKLVGGDITPETGNWAVDAATH